MSNDPRSRPPPRVQVKMGQGAAEESPASSPSRQVLARANKTFETTDARGRRIVLRKPSTLAEFRFVEMLGANASNERYFAMALPILFVVKIDDEDVLPPARKSELEALIKLLDEDGLTAIQECLKEHFGEKDKNPDADPAFREEVKS